jgi:putative FmdB family regulatory protein
MPSYDYECQTCGEVVEISHSIKQDALTEFDCPACGSTQPCKRIVCYNYCKPIFKGDGWTIPTSGYGKRGYKGRFSNLVRDVGTPVDAPNHKVEADRQFQQYIDSGGLQGIKPTFDLSAKARPMTGAEMIDKGKDK